MGSKTYRPHLDLKDRTADRRIFLGEPSQRKPCTLHDKPQFSISLPQSITMGWGGGSQIQGCFFGGPYKKDYSFSGSVLGSPYSGKLPYGNREKSKS